MRLAWFLQQVQMLPQAGEVGDGFAVDVGSLSHDPGIEVTHINLNDDTVEGLRHRELPLFSVQYHPEASPGPHDSHDLFQEFCELVPGSNRASESES